MTARATLWFCSFSYTVWTASSVSIRPPLGPGEQPEQYHLYQIIQRGFNLRKPLLEFARQIIQPGA
jgi:hypothetical protein